MNRNCKKIASGNYKEATEMSWSHNEDRKLGVFNTHIKVKESIEQTT